MRRSAHSIEPVRKELRLDVAPTEAFRHFTHEMGEWWPLGTHSIAALEASGVRFEGRVGGRVIELVADGTEHAWADVLTWDPPHRVVLSWHPTPEPVAASKIDVRFGPQADGTLMHLEHRDWEEFGATEGAALRADYDPGWDIVLAPFRAPAMPATTD